MSVCLSDDLVVRIVEMTAAAEARNQALEHCDACAPCRRLLASAARAIVPSSDGAAGAADGDIGSVVRGVRVGRFEVLGLLGVGAMGEVHAAYDPQLDRRVALKIMRSDGEAAGATERSRRLLREAQAMAQLSHPNVAAIYDVGTHAGRPFIAMELVVGGTIRAWAATKRRSWRAILAHYIDAGRGLAAAHAAGIVHRDFKPENVLVGHDGRVRVVDFGLAHATPRDFAGDAAAGADGRALMLTRSNELLGTPAYMAPEQMPEATGGRLVVGEVAFAADQFSFCASLYEALFGHRPFAGLDLAELRANIARAELVPPRRGVKVAGSVRRALGRGLRAHPGERFPSMDALVEALRDHPPASPAPGASGPKTFVGRARPLAVLRALPGMREPRPIAFVHGPGGIGKTTLLQRACEHYRGLGLRVARIDGGDTESTPAAFLLALGRQTNAVHTPSNIWPCRGEWVVCVDGYEKLGPIDEWVRESFVAELPSNVVMIIGGRSPPARSWSEVPRSLKALELRGLSRHESLRMLRILHVPRAQHDAIVALTRGHPMALRLAAETCLLRPGVAFGSAAAPDMLRALLGVFLETVPSAFHRRALEACSLVRALTESQLESMLAIPDGHALFDWLRALSCVGIGPEGLVPHDLVRDLITDELRWRNPDWYATLADRAHAYAVEQVRRDPSIAERVVGDVLFIRRHHPFIQPFLEFGDGADLSLVPASANDVPHLLAMVERHEGAASARIAAHWLARDRTNTSVVRNGAGTPLGFLTRVLLAPDTVTDDDLAIDPATRNVWQHIVDHDLLRAGEVGEIHRFFMAWDTYQKVSRIQNLFPPAMGRAILTTPGLRFHALVLALPHDFGPLLAAASSEVMAGLEFEVGPRRYELHAVDMRRLTPIAWLSQLAAYPAPPA